MVSLVCVGYSTWLINNSDLDKSGSTSGTISAPTHKTEDDSAILKFSDKVKASDLATPNDENSYTADKLSAQLSYTENSSYPLNDNFDFYDEDYPKSDDSPKLLETNSGHKFSFENYSFDENNSTISSEIFYKLNYNYLSGDSLASSDTEIEKAIKLLPFVSAPPVGYTSQYKIYSSSTSKSNAYRMVVTRLQNSTTTTNYRRYRCVIFFKIKHNGSTYLTYNYSDLSSHGWNADTTDDYPSITDKTDFTSLPTSKKSTIGIKPTITFTSKTYTPTINLCDTSFSGNSGYDPYYEIIDTTKVNSDFDDSYCKQYVKDFMSTNVTKSSTTTICEDDDIITDTDKDSSGNLILGIDTSRFPYIKTVLARTKIKSSNYWTYRNYRIFHFVYSKFTNKLIVINNGSYNCNRNNFYNSYPTVSLRSPDETSNSSSIARNTYSETTIRVSLTYDYNTKYNGSTTNVTEYLVQKMTPNSTIARRVVKDKTQDDFDDESIYSYIRTTQGYGKDGSGYETEILYKYNDVKNYVSNIDSFPYIKFALSRRKYTNSSTGVITYRNFYLIVITWQQSYSGGSYDVNFASYGSDYQSYKDYWITYTIANEGTSSANSIVSDSNEFTDPSKLYVTRKFYNGVSATALSSNSFEWYFLGYDSNMYTKTINQTEAEEEAEKNEIIYNNMNKYSIYYGVDFDRPHYFTCYQKAGNYYYSYSYFKKGENSGTTATEANDVQLKLTNSNGTSYLNAKYNAYVYNSSGIALTTSIMSTKYKLDSYEIYQPCRKETAFVIFHFKNSSTNDVMSYAVNIGTGGETKTYFSDFLDTNKLEYLDFIFTIKFRPKTTYAKQNAETLLKSYNFNFSIVRKDRLVHSNGVES